MTGLLNILMAFGSTSSPVVPAAQALQDEASNPAQVTNLVVTDSSGTSRTISFTQVDDGTGHPADYAVRFQIGPIDWATAAEVVYGSCAAPVQGTGIGARISCTVDNLVPENTYTFQVAAFRGTFRGRAVYGALSKVVPYMEESAPRSSGSHPNEPAGYSVISASSFPCLPDIDGADCVSAGDWSTYNPHNNLDVADDALRHTLPKGHRAGTGGATMDTWDTLGSPTPMKELYVSQHVRLRSGNGDGLYEFYSGTNKLGFWGTQAPGGVPSDFLLRASPSDIGAGKGVLDDSAVLGIVQQNNVSRSAWANARIQVDAWHRWEFQFVLNDPANNFEASDKYGNARIHGDGIFRWWQDGQLILKLTNVAFATDASHGFYTYRWNPTWGGGAEHDDKARADYIYIDDLYISGVPK